MSREPRHGYELEAHVTNISRGRVASGNATVYKAVKRLAGDGLVTVMVGSQGDRRRYYEITREGRAQLGRDLGLLRRTVQAFDERF
ncbi:MAG TPA: helix-turn-helix transcriptional regulator [Candidatus Saccharimonadia bacterium]|nr:helix-turn-helix transcriptional regulator [Candidatus Saccharimonadia bacterium]